MKYSSQTDAASLLETLRGRNLQITPSNNYNQGHTAIQHISNEIDEINRSHLMQEFRSTSQGARDLGRTYTPRRAIIDMLHHLREREQARDRLIASSGNLNLDDINPTIDELHPEVVEEGSGLRSFARRMLGYNNEVSPLKIDEKMNQNIDSIIKISFDELTKIRRGRGESLLSPTVIEYLKRDPKMRKMAINYLYPDKDNYHKYKVVDSSIYTDSDDRPIKKHLSEPLFQLSDYIEKEYEGYIHNGMFIDGEGIRRRNNNQEKTSNRPNRSKELNFKKFVDLHKKLDKSKKGKSIQELIKDVIEPYEKLSRYKNKDQVIAVKNYLNKLKR
jgi:hypothetical protein